MLNISLVVADTASLTPLFSWLKGAPPGINPSSYQQKKSLGLCLLAHPWFRSSLTFSNNDTLLSRLSPPPLYGNPQWRGNLFFYLLPLLAGFLTLVSSAVEEITRFKHWLNFCPIPALAGSLLLNRPWRTRYWYFTRSHSLEHRSIIASLWVATRQFVHERSGLPPAFPCTSFRFFCQHFSLSTSPCWACLPVASPVLSFPHRVHSFLTVFLA